MASAYQPSAASGSLDGVGLHALAPAPEDVGGRAELHPEVDRPHGLLQRVRAHARVVRGERAVPEDRVAEEVGRGHRDHEPGRVERLLEVGDDLVPLVRARVDRHEVVVVQVHAPGARPRPAARRAAPVRAPRAWAHRTGRTRDDRRSRARTRTGAPGAGSYVIAHLHRGRRVRRRRVPSGSASRARRRAPRRGGRSR